jgi:hypothetical protein
MTYLYCEPQKTFDDALEHAQVGDLAR